MRTMILLALVVAVALAAPSTFYSEKYDNFDADALIENGKLLKAYSECFLEQGPCTPEGKDIRSILPEAIETTCGKCSPKQRVLVRKVMRAMKEKIPENWDAMRVKYDPEAKYATALNEFLAEED